MAMSPGVPHMGYSSNLNDFNYRNKALTAKLLRQGYRYFKLRKTFSKFYRRHSALLEKYCVSLKTLLQQGISELEFYVDHYWFSFTLAYSRMSHEYSSLFIIVINLIFMFSLWCIDWGGSLYANRIFMYLCIKSSIGTQGEVGLL